MDAGAALELRHIRSANTPVGRLPRVLVAPFLRSELGKASAYSVSHWRQLSIHLEHGCVVIDNNAMENAIRPTALGKKNWFSWVILKRANAPRSSTLSSSPASDWRSIRRPTSATCSFKTRGQWTKTRSPRGSPKTGSQASPEGRMLNPLRLQEVDGSRPFVVGYGVPLVVLAALRRGSEG